MNAAVRLIAITALLWCLGYNLAQAACPFNTPHVRVGSDAYCDYSDIQPAIAAVVDACPVVVDIAGASYGNQHLNISGKKITLQGYGAGVSCYNLTQCIPSPCAPPSSTAALVTLDGGGSGGSVITVDGFSAVNLRNLTITHGQAGSNGYGGGINFIGSGFLNLTNTAVSNNDAGYGGGISITGTDSGVVARLFANTLVLSNQASISGGGIRLDGVSRLFALAPQTYIAFNHALVSDNGGYGGGVEIIGPARADIASPGYNGAPVIDFNDAKYGGGVAVVGASGSAALRLFTVDADHPVQVSRNTAANTGGGVYLKTVWDGTSVRSADLCAYDFRVDDNIAQEGTAVYSDLDTDSLTGDQVTGDVVLNSSPYVMCTAPETPLELGAVACAPGVACNTMNGNVAENNSNTPTPGSVILVQNDGGFEADRLVLSGNQGAHAIRIIDPQVVNDYLSNCLIVDNQLTSEVITAQTGDYISAIHFSDCTIANNVIGSGSVLRSQFAMSLDNGIIYQPGVPTLDYTGPAEDLSVSYVLSNETDTLPVGPGVAQGAPAFVDAAGGDYHLQVSSPGIDYAPAHGGNDLDRVSRDVDLTSVPNNYGPRDIGAYERQFACAADTVFCNGFEGNP